MFAQQCVQLGFRSCFFELEHDGLEVGILGAFGAGEGEGELAAEQIVAVGEFLAPVGAEEGESVADGLGGAEAFEGIEEVVGVALFVKAAGNTRVFGAFERPDAAAEVEVSFSAGFESRISHVGEEVLQPGVFEAQADLEEEVGGVEFADEAGLDLDRVRVLRALTEAEDLDPMATHLAGNVGKVGGGGDHSERFGGRFGGARGRSRHRQPEAQGDDADQGRGERTGAHES